MVDPVNCPKVRQLLPDGSMWSGDRVTIGRFTDGKKFVIEDNFNIHRDIPSIITQRWRGHVLLMYVNKGVR